MRSASDDVSAVDDVRLAVCGAGAMGKNHMAAIGSAAGACLCAVADPVAEPPPTSAGGVPWFKSLQELIDTASPDGIVVATPNRAHRDNALLAISARCPVLIEKPLAASLDDGRAIVAAAERAGVICAVGHHRRHSPHVSVTREVVASGQLGAIRAVHASAWLPKPADYFAAPWRRAAGAGPILVNLIHDIDTVRALVGDVTQVSAAVRPSARGHPVEDGAAVILQFQSGALGTLTVSDTIAGPFSWELTAGENPIYPRNNGCALWIGGERASLSLPNPTLWEHDGGPSWTAPLMPKVLPVANTDPLVAQMENFARAIRGRDQVRATAREGWRTLAVVDAIMRAAELGSTVTPSQLDE
ncbi:MAG: Gfo/Idh/MocA family oxidoreductase [Pseudomonadota bacterium]